MASRALDDTENFGLAIPIQYFYQICIAIPIPIQVLGPSPIPIPIPIPIQIILGKDEIFPAYGGVWDYTDPYRV